MTTEEKLRWASGCGLEWPCVGDYVEPPFAQSRVAFHINTQDIDPIDGTGAIVSIPKLTRVLRFLNQRLAAMTAKTLEQSIRDQA